MRDLFRSSPRDFSGLVSMSASWSLECNHCIYAYWGKKANDTILIGVWVDVGILGTKTKKLALAVIDHLEKGFETISKPAPDSPNY